jgi:hypothetical protein
VPEHERGWDITRDGVPVAITPEELIALPLGLPVALLMAVFADVSDPNRVRPCSAGSSPADGSEGRLTTTASSKTRNGRISPPGRSPASTTPPAGSAGGSG